MTFLGRIMTAELLSVTLADRVTQSSEVLVQEMGGEAVLLDLASERYFGLDPIGTRIWTLVGEHDSLQAVAEVIADEYDASTERLHADLLALVTQLAEAGLVNVV